MRLAEMVYIRTATVQRLFSLRPEAIQIASDVLPVSARYIRFRGTIQQQIYGGASELLEIECGAGQLVARAHTGSRLR